MNDRSKELEELIAGWEPPPTPSGAMRLADVTWEQVKAGMSVHAPRRTWPPPALGALLILLLLLAGLLYFMNGGAGPATW